MRIFVLIKIMMMIIEMGDTEKRVKNWQENTEDNVTAGIAPANIHAYMKLVQETLNVKTPELIEHLTTDILKMSKSRDQGGLSKSIEVKDGNTRKLAVFYCSKDSDGSLTVAYAVHSLSYEFVDTYTEEMMTVTDQKLEAEKRLRQLGFEVENARDVTTFIPIEPKWPFYLWPWGVLVAVTAGVLCFVNENEPETHGGFFSSLLKGIPTLGSIFSQSTESALVAAEWKRADTIEPNEKEEKKPDDVPDTAANEAPNGAPATEASQEADSAIPDAADKKKAVVETGKDSVTVLLNPSREGEEEDAILTPM